jgi:dephospho-CoA kinase
MLTFVCGQLCCGKTLYSQTLSAMVDGMYIEVGDIVRELKQTKNREDLQNSKDLTSQIIEQIKHRTSSQTVRQFVVSGVRQKEILKEFPEATLLWIQCPKQIRKKRYEARLREGDEMPFKNAEQGDIKLGILEVKKYILKSK